MIREYTQTAAFAAAAEMFGVRGCGKNHFFDVQVYTHGTLWGQSHALVKTFVPKIAIIFH